MAAGAQNLPAGADSLGQQLVAGHPGGAVIGIVDDGRWAVAGFGAADTAGTPPSAETIFEIGSVTKTFTGLLLAEAAVRGSLRSGDPVAPYLPDSLAFPASEHGPITLEQLATHRSGLPRIPANLRATVTNPADPYANYTVRDLYAFLDGHRLARPPDSAYAYSNLGMGLLGHVLARRADTSYAALVQHRIAEPLGLADTRIALTADQQARFAQGYAPTGTPTPPWQIPALAGAGALRASAADMLAYVRAHLAASDTTRLGRAMRRAITPRAAADLGDNEAFAGTRIGYAWHMTPRAGQTVVWHNGGTGGFSSFVGFHRATGHGVVVLVSAGGSASQATAVGFALLEALLSTADPASDQ